MACLTLAIPACNSSGESACAPNSSPPSRHALPWTEGVHHGLRLGLQHLVADIVAERVVYVLEVVNVRLGPVRLHLAGRFQLRAAHLIQQARDVLAADLRRGKRRFQDAGSTPRAGPA
jgi:hypothetical protein